MESLQTPVYDSAFAARPPTRESQLRRARPAGCSCCGRGGLIQPNALNGSNKAGRNYQPVCGWRGRDLGSYTVSTNAPTRGLLTHCRHTGIFAICSAGSYWHLLRRSVHLSTQKRKLDFSEQSCTRVHCGYDGDRGDGDGDAHPGVRWRGGQVEADQEDASQRYVLSCIYRRG